MNTKQDATAGFAARGGYGVPRAITTMEALDYEVKSSWWASWVSSPMLQNIAASYYAWKVNRKWRRYAANRAMAENLKQLHTIQALPQGGAKKGNDEH